ncbi:interferon-like [Pelecanus crispus]|uniref:interferon-like n=1 Tax=Pelecanus crispus TaxID=36300 RepID=UPI003F5D33FF
MAVPATPQPCLRHSAPVLLLLLPALTTALTCQPASPRPHLPLAQPPAQLLQAMAPSPPQPCHHQHTHFPFPNTLLHTSHPQQAAATALCILQHLFTTLSSPSTPHHWDAPARHQLLSNLQHYIYHLEQCLPANGMLFEGQGPRNLLLGINKYFGRIQDFLRTHHHSPCDWDHVCLEARICFQHVDILIWQMKSRTAPALHQTHLRQMPIPSQHWQPQIEWMQQQPGLGLLSTAHTFSSQEPVPTGKRA